MTRIKQISIWLIALIGLITALGAAAQNSGNTGPLRWEYNAGTNTLSITGTGAMPNYASTDDQPWKAFQSGIKTVIIGDNVTTIGEHAFAACNALQNVTLGSRVQTIEVSAFGTCQALQSISFPASVTTIGKHAFLNCRVLQNVSFSDGLTTIGEGAFSDCVVLQSITLPASVTTIGEYAFAFCKALQQVTVAWDTPLAVPDKTFWGVNTANVPLKVPKGREAAYQATPVWKSFKINSPPAPGNGGKLTISNITSNGFTVSWEKATDVETPQKNLIYKVYCKGGGGLLLFKPTDLKATLTDKASYTITGLGGSITIINPALDKGYDVNVEVEDEDGSSAWYNEENVKLASATVAVSGVTVAPATATDQSLTWTSSDASVASVDGAGLVTIRKKGKATVTAKANDGSGVSASCLFDVIRTVANETIDGLRIYAADGALRLALPKTETVHIYNVEGSLVKTLILPAGDHVQPLPSGVYVVRVGERVAKVMVK